MRLPVLLALLFASILDQARASDVKRDLELVLLSPERLDNVGHGNSRPPCPPRGCTSADSKLCWDGKHDICTNYYTTVPPNGKLVRYVLDITSATRAPDGVPRKDALVINGTIPGPTITANWGDTVEIVIRNLMKDNGTSIHWHGIRQHRNFMNDGVNGVTECPIAPGQQKTYRWLAEQYGTSWYHSHHTVQYGDGVFGAINILGPTTAEYDIDLGPVSLSDWFYKTAFWVMHAEERTGKQTADNFLVEGRNLNLNDSRAEGPGSHYNLTFQPGKRHLLRFINTSTQTFFRVSLDNHNMTVVQTDFVPIVPYVTDTVDIAIGQRYMVIIEANQANATYWLRTWPQNSCSGYSANNGTGIASAYVRYESAPDVLPTSTSVVKDETCDDEFDNIEPYLLVNIDQSGFSDPKARETMDVDGPLNYTRPGTNYTIHRWNIGHQLDAGMSVSWSNPVVKQLLQDMNESRRARSGDTSYSCAQALAALPSQLNSYCIDGDNATSYWIINNNSGAHPLHLHNHDFNIVARGNGPFSPKKAKFNWKSPPRRDTVSLPEYGYVVIAFMADNPSISIFHCHIAWHVGEGFSLQLIERPSEIPKLAPLSHEWNRTCDKWIGWYKGDGPDQDSGLR